MHEKIKIKKGNQTNASEKNLKWTGKQQYFTMGRSQAVIETESRKDRKKLA